MLQQPTYDKVNEREQLLSAARRRVSSVLTVELALALVVPRALTQHTLHPTVTLTVGTGTELVLVVVCAWCVLGSRSVRRFGFQVRSMADLSMTTLSHCGSGVQQPAHCHRMLMSRIVCCATKSHKTLLKEAVSRCTTTKLQTITFDVTRTKESGLRWPRVEHLSCLYLYEHSTRGCRGLGVGGVSRALSISASRGITADSTEPRQRGVYAG